MADESQNIDQQLTTEFGSYLEGSTQLDSIQDGLIQVLSRFKDEYFEPVVDSRKDEVWALIDKQIQAPARIHRLDKRSGFKIWTIAATVLIASFVGFYLVFMNQSTEIMLQTYAKTQEIILPDGTEVTLRPYSKLIKLRYSDSQQAYAMEGEGYFSVMKVENREFTVSTGNGKVTVLGTRFNLSTWGEGTQVYLEEGSLRFENNNTTDAVILEPGESARTVGIGTVTKDEQVYANEFNDWRSNLLVFNNKELIKIIAEPEQHFNIVVSIPEGINNVILNGGLTLESPEQSLEYLALTLDGTFKQITEKEYRFVPLTE